MSLSSLTLVPHDISLTWKEVAVALTHGVKNVENSVMYTGAVLS